MLMPSPEPTPVGLVCQRCRNVMRVTPAPGQTTATCANCKTPNVLGTVDASGRRTMFGFPIETVPLGRIVGVPPLEEQPRQGIQG